VTQWRGFVLHGTTTLPQPTRSAPPTALADRARSRQARSDAPAAGKLGGMRQEDGPMPKLVSATVGLALLAWLGLALGLLYAAFVVTEPPPNVVITFSDKGLTRLAVELAALAVGALGVLAAAVAFARGARRRALVLGTLGNVSVCVVCVGLLM
jgi:hypothetical protein